MTPNLDCDSAGEIVDGVTELIVDQRHSEAGIIGLRDKERALPVRPDR